MSRKIRELGQYPLKNGKPMKWGDRYYCEACGRHDNVCNLGVDLGQCPECGRWVCRNCWDSDKGVCKVCAKYISLKPFDKSEIEKLYKKIKEIEEHIIKINEKVKKINFCQYCNIPLPSTAKYCGICGKKLPQ